jgi:hypothetical protein
MIRDVLTVLSTALFRAAKSALELRGDYLQARIAYDDSVREADFRHDDRLGDISLEVADDLSRIAKPINQSWVNDEIRRVNERPTAAYDPLEVEGEELTDEEMRLQQEEETRNLADEEGYHFVSVPVDKVIEAVGGDAKFMDLIRIMVDSVRFSLDDDAAAVRLVGFEIGADNEVTDELLRAVRDAVTRDDLPIPTATWDECERT